MVVSPFELVNSNVWGLCPATCKTKTDFKYFVTFVNDYSRVTWLYLLKNRSKPFTHFCSLFAGIKTRLMSLFKLWVMTMQMKLKNVVVQLLC